MLASDGEQVGTVHHVVAAPEKDIFHGLVITTPAPRPALRRGRGRRVAARTRRRPAHRLGGRAEPARSRAAAHRCTTRTPRRRPSGATGCASTRGAATGTARAERRQPARPDRGRPSGRDCWHNRTMSIATEQRHGRGRLRRALGRAGGAAALAAGGALLSGAARARGGGLLAAHAVPARPRPDRALQGVPPADAQDAGVRGAARRPLPHAADAHARGDERSRARSRARCA